ncbi:MAG: hypothetical protein DRI97_16250 [Bacteroidetes bacterium]|nr:MAG: hypothetical protein DRI97_16250 [Bacteroidota bacterium]
MGAASLPKMVKPATCGQATSMCSHGALRGGWGGRARTVAPRNLGGPSRRRARRQPLPGTHNRQGAASGVGEAHSSQEAG